jgi:hypothetical protein
VTCTRRALPLLFQKQSHVHAQGLYT